MVNQIKQLVCLVEEPSAREMLNGILPRLGVQHYQFIVFEGKQDLQKRLTRTLKAWPKPNCVFLILRDKDAGDCHQIKKRLLELCISTGKEVEVFIRIACHELESFYLGDLAAVEQGLGLTGISGYQNNKKFRDPDRLSNPAQELSSLTKGVYRKVVGSRKISQYLNLRENRSHSFKVLLEAISRVMTIYPQIQLPL